MNPSPMIIKKIKDLNAAYSFIRHMTSTTCSELVAQVRALEFTEKLPDDISALPVAKDDHVPSIDATLNTGFNMHMHEEALAHKSSVKDTTYSIETKNKDIINKSINKSQARSMPAESKESELVHKAEKCRADSNTKAMEAVTNRSEAETQKPFVGFVQEDSSRVSSTPTEPLVPVRVTRYMCCIRSSVLSPFMLPTHQHQHQQSIRTPCSAVWVRHKLFRSRNLLKGK